MEVSSPASQAGTTAQLDASQVEEQQRRERRIRDVKEATATAMPLTFGKVFLAVLLANIVSAVVIAIGYAVVTSR